MTINGLKSQNIQYLGCSISGNFFYKNVNTGIHHSKTTAFGRILGGFNQSMYIYREKPIKIIFCCPSNSDVIIFITVGKC